MSDEQQRHDRPTGQGGWQPIPGTEFEADGTTFLQLPPELLAHPGADRAPGAWDPLAATGAGGYTPPTAEQWQQPGAAVPAQQQWTPEPGARATAPYEHAPAPAGHATAGHAPEAHAPVGHPAGGHAPAGHPPAGHVPAAHEAPHHPDPHATAEWANPFVGDSTGQGHWSVPVAGDDPVDESGEYVLHSRTAPHAQGAAVHGHTPPHAADPHAADPHGAGTEAPGEHIAHGHPAPHEPVGDTGDYAVPLGDTGDFAMPLGDTGDTGDYVMGGAAEYIAATQWPAPAPAAAPAPVEQHAPAPAQHVPVAQAQPPQPQAVAEAPAVPVPQQQHSADVPVADAQWSGDAHAWEPEVPAGTPTGQWSVPVVPGEPADESGEYALTPFPATPEPIPAADSVSLPDGSSHVGGVTDTGDHPVAAWTPPVEPAAEAPAPEPAPAVEPEPVPEPVPVPVAEPDPVSVPVAAHEDELPPSAEAPPASPASPPGEQQDVADAHHTEHPCASYVLRVNGTDRPVTDAWIGESLLYVLRERLGLAGAKDGCSQGECGACSVQVDGRLVASCLVPAATAAGAEVRTVEGLAADGRPSDVQRALAECGAVQCGFCVPGMAMTMHDLLEGNHAPTELEARQAFCGNLCRCSGYRGVLDAVRQVADERAAAAAAQDEAQPEAEQARIPHQAGPHGSGKAMG
ncbi:(2Fe-2S)-binding protein [Streptomyces griseocarneus]|nr:(2Fe-2S)-binding protein [Streptomyces griseocarneus]